MLKKSEISFIISIAVILKLNIPLLGLVKFRSSDSRCFSHENICAASGMTESVKMNMRWKREIIGAACFLILLGLDQLTKYLAMIHLKAQPAVPIIKNIFELQYLENHGAAFGMLQKQRVFLLCFTMIILVLLVFLYKKLPDNKRYLPLRFLGILIGAGAVGNLIDRMIQGYVIDFFYFKLIDFPIFNVADCYVVIAAFLLFFLVCFFYKDEDFDFLKKKGKNERRNGD